MSRSDILANAEEWHSSSPDGSFVHIDIPGEKVMFDNDGTVAIIDADQRHWTFAMVHSPLDDYHPVSGNREFGYTENEDGSTTFYTRGVDRIQERWMDSANSASKIVPFYAARDGVVFAGGDALWRSFQQRLVTGIERQGGEATAEAPVVARPDFRAVERLWNGIDTVDQFNRRNP